MGKWNTEIAQRNKEEACLDKISRNFIEKFLELSVNMKISKVIFLCGKLVKGEMSKKGKGKELLKTWFPGPGR